MSSRVLKKLHGDNFEIKDQNLSDVENDVTDVPKKPVNINRYDLLLNQQQSQSESEFKEDDNETEHTSAASQLQSQAKKKKKKRKRKSGKVAAARRSSEDNADIDELIESVKMMDTVPDVEPTSGGSVCQSKRKNIFTIHHKNLNPANELKKLFGSRVIQADQVKRRNPRGARPMKSVWLVNSKENWPPLGKTGLSMKIVPSPYENLPGASTSKDNRVWYAFEHSSSYRQLQQKFIEAVESMDSTNIMSILVNLPYHIDALLQFSEICKRGENLAMASDLNESAILAFESSFHSTFSLTAGNCCLDFRRQENRSLFIALFRHAQFLEGRACCRTALEIAKLIYTFDPDKDPLAMILILDYYALRSKEYDWLIELYEELEQRNNLSQLPNMAYSYALALFFKHGKGDTALADKALQYALLMFPGVLKPLLEEISAQPDGRVKSHGYFGIQTASNQSPALEQLVLLYVYRASSVWKDITVLPWLEKNVHCVLDRVDAKDEIVNEYKAKRACRYLSPPRAILRHVLISDLKEKLPLACFIDEPILTYDPLPPIDSIDIYPREGTRSTTRSSNTSNSSPWSTFFQSLLPTYGMPNTNANANANNVNGRDNEGAAGNNDPDGAGGGAGASLYSIVDTVRDLLVNIRVERPNDADIEEDDSGADD